MMLTVPVFLPSYGWSGETHLYETGDRASWELTAVDEWFLPKHLLASLTAVAEPAGSPIAERRYYPTLLRQGGLTAWWNADRPVSGDIELRAWFRMDDQRVEPGEVPATHGTVGEVHLAYGFLLHDAEGRNTRVPAIGLREVGTTHLHRALEITRETPGYTAYFKGPALDPNDGTWDHMGWIAMLEVDGAVTGPTDSA